MMSAERFKLINGVKVGTHSGIWDNRKQHNMGIGDELWVGEVVAMLNKGVALAEENKELRKIINEMKDIIYMLQEVYVIGEYSSEIGEDMQELQKAYNGNLEDFLKYIKED
jgi:hypothetical protein